MVPLESVSPGSSIQVRFVKPTDIVLEQETGDRIVVPDVEELTGDFDGVDRDSVQVTVLRAWQRHADGLDRVPFLAVPENGATRVDPLRVEITTLRFSRSRTAAAIALPIGLVGVLAILATTNREGETLRVGCFLFAC